MLKTINKNWKFVLKDKETAWLKDFDDTGWKEVTLPHDWAVEGDFSLTNSSGTGYLQGGTAWYRGEFYLPEEFKGKKIRVIFDGVYKNSRVWCNSSYLGERPNGYIGFSYDISHCASFGEEKNVLSVKVSHEDISDSRWYTGSGITRKVSVLVQENAYFTEDGVTFTSNLNNENAEVSIKNFIANENADCGEFTVTNKLIDANGVTVLELTSNQKLAQGETKIAEHTGVINSPNLWSDEEPNLYTLQSFMTISGEACNLREEKVGIRSFYFDTEKGFFINGKNKKLKGLCVHHDAGCLGAAVPQNVWRRRLEKFKKVGCNAIRLSHNPHTPELIDLCDEMGFYVIDEAFDEWEGCKNKWWNGHNVYPPRHQGYSKDFPQWHEKDLRDLIKRDKNHASVILWSIGNEIDYPNDPYCHPNFKTMEGNNDKNKPAKEREYNPAKPNMERLTEICKRLADIAKDEDSTRPVTAAVAFPELSTYLGYIEPLDVVGYNYKEQYYENDHKRFPNKPFMGSENSHGFKQWKSARDNEYVAGQFLWTGADYLGETPGWPRHGSIAGLLTTAGFEKTKYWYRSALWRDEPVAVLATSRAADVQETEFDGFEENWNYADNENVLVRCFTNQASAELFLGDKSLGKKDNDDQKGYIEWEVAYAHMPLSVKTESATATIKPVEKAVSIELKTYEKEIFANGEDIVQIEVSLKDREGRDTLDEEMLSVNVENCEFLGIDNGDLEDNTSYRAFYRRTYNGKMIIYVRSLAQKTTAKVSVKGKHFAEKTIEINCI